MNDVIDSKYLPFTVDELVAHMPPVGLARSDRADRWLSHFVRSANAYHTFLSQSTDRRGVPISVARKACQIEKDERFWVAATWMQLMRQPNAGEIVGRLLARIYGQEPPVEGVSEWSELTDGPLSLYFEANLPSPKIYLGAVADRISMHPVEYVRHAARRSASESMRSTLEGPTNVDALVVNSRSGLGLLIEAKVMSDVSHDVSFDPFRNQIARNVDVMLEANERLPDPLSRRQPDRTFFLLLTPQLFVDNPSTRLYGWLMHDYCNELSGALHRDLPHRSADDIAGARARIGWTSWEEIGQEVPGACPWLETP